MAKMILSATAAIGMRARRPHPAISRARPLAALLALYLAATLTGCEGASIEQADSQPVNPSTPALPPEAASAGQGAQEQPSGSVSLDCVAPRSPVERLICGTPGVVRLDGQLSSAYEAALSVAEASAKPTLRQEQESWIGRTRDLCQDAICLEQVYAARIEVLSKGGATLSNQVSCQTPTGAKACVNVVVYRDPNSRIDAFNEVLGQQGETGLILGCRALIDLPAGTSGGNHSFGGHCVLEKDSKRTDVRICNDEMVGNFAIEPVEPNREGIKELIDFTSDRCAEG